MARDRFVRITDVWSWLPTFRAVAEARSIRRAAKELMVAPSAVSRTIRLLEAGISQPLFQRAGQRLVLSPEGARLLSAVRDAMRGVDDGLVSVLGHDVGEVRIATSDTLALTLVIPALAKCMAAAPTLRVRLSPALGDLRSRLVDGDLDLVCGSQPTVHSALRITQLADLSASVYCGESHPLRRRRRLSSADLAAHGFIAPPPAEDGTPADGWPVQLERTVSVIVHSLRQGVDLCALGVGLAVFPDRVAGGLHRLPLSMISASRVYLSARRTLGNVGSIELVTQELVSLGAKQPSIRANR